MFAKLDATMVLAIFARKGEKQAVVASDFNVSQTTVSAIWLGKVWRKVTGMPEYVSSKKPRGSFHLVGA
jgi:hypothetical protein